MYTFKEKKNRGHLFKYIYALTRRKKNVPAVKMDL